MGVLNFNRDNLITGANIIDGILHWVDDLNEPRQIEIEKFRNGNHDSGTTVVDGRQFRHEDITVIKPHPYQAIDLELIEYTPPTDGTLPEPPFEEIFPRFSYRWRYDNGQYSPMAPFTEAAFLPETRTPGTDEGQTDRANYTEGYNTTLRNNVGIIRLRNIPRGGPDVVAVDILYTESISQTVYILETLEVPQLVRGIDFNVGPGYDGQGAVAANEYAIQPLNYDVTARKIYRALPTDQLGRLFDNVPKTAKSQETTANRLIYANYVQNYDQSDVVMLDIDVLPAESFPYLEIDGNNQFLGTTYRPLDERATAARDELRSQSRADGINVKSNRTYEVGVTYIDAFGRQGALLAAGSEVADDGSVEASAAFRVPFFQDGRQALACRITSAPPEWAVKYRYWIKDVSQDFHSLISYNIYNAGLPEETNSEHVWLEFQSTDRNKISDDTVLVLRRNNDTVSSDKLRFQVQDIEGEAPDDVRTALLRTPANTRINPVGTIPGSAWFDIDSETTTNTITIRDQRDAVPFQTYINVFNNYLRTNGFQTLITLADGEVEQQINLLEDGNEETNPLYISFSGDEDAFAQVTTLTKVTYDEDSDTDGNRPGIRITFGDRVTIDMDTGEVTPTGMQGLPSRPGGDENISLFTSTVTDEATSRLQGRFWVRVARQGLETMQSQFNFDGELETLQQFWFETEQVIDDSNLDFYWESSDTFCVCTEHGWPNKIRWSNCISEYLDGAGIYLDSQRIFNRFNSVQVVKGVRVNVPGNERYAEERRSTGLIWSGLYNSRNGINNLNEFPNGQNITKEIEPNYGSIQKLHTRDTNLITFAEDKVFRILADKDQLFNADGGGNVSATNRPLGQTTPYNGEYGISRNPESFAFYGQNVYFSDSNRGVMCQLTPANGQITEISGRGMNDFFRDRLFSSERIIGMFDDYSDKYITSLQGYNAFDAIIAEGDRFPGEGENEFGDRIEGNITLGYELDTNAWTTRMSFIPEMGVNLNNKFYTWRNGQLWLHNSNTSPWNNYYGSQDNSEIEVIFNDSPSQVINFLALNYEGTSGWEVAEIETNSPYDMREVGLLGDWVEREGKYYQAITSQQPTYVYDESQPNNVREDGTRMVSGAKGFYCKVRLRTTAEGSRQFQELFAISTEVIPSS